MRRRVSSIAVTGLLIASGGALAAANTVTPMPDVTTVTAGTPAASPPAPGADGTDSPARTPPGLAKKEDKTPPGLAKKEARNRAGAAGRSEPSEDPGRGVGRGPDATGPSASGLCHAWANQQDPAAKAERVPPFRNLAAAAGGVDSVEAYCAALPERPVDEDD